VPVCSLVRLCSFALPGLPLSLSCGSRSPFLPVARFGVSRLPALTGRGKPPLYSLQLPLSASSLRCYSGRFWSPGVVACGVCGAAADTLEPPFGSLCGGSGSGFFTRSRPFRLRIPSGRLSLSGTFARFAVPLPLSPLRLAPSLCCACLRRAFGWSLSQVFSKSLCHPPPRLYPRPRPAPCLGPLSRPSIFMYSTIVYYLSTVLT